MNAGMSRRLKKVLVFMVVAETVENQIQETFKDAGDEENGPDLSEKIIWFSEFLDGNERKVIIVLKKEDGKDVGMRFSQCPW